MKKVSAFTLQELVIVMIITTVVVGIAFTVLTLVQRHMLSIQQNFNTNTEINVLESALWSDFHKAGTVHLKKEAKQLVFNQVLDTIVYKYHENHVIRDRDTLPVGIVNTTFFNKGAEVEDGKIDALEWEFSKKQPHQKVFVYKRNDAIQYFQ